MKKQDIIKFFCELSSTVRRRHFNCEIITNCFCNQSDINETCFKFDSKAAEFIKKAVTDAIELEKTGVNQKGFDQYDSTIDQSFLYKTISRERFNASRGKLKDPTPAELTPAELTPAELIHKLSMAIKKREKITDRILYKIKKLEKFTTMEQNDSGDINIVVRGQDTNISEASYRLIVQKDVNELIKDLKTALSAIEEFNEKIK